MTSPAARKGAMTRVVLLGSPPGAIDSSPPAPVPPPRAGAPDDKPDTGVERLDGLPGAPTAYGRLLGQAAALDPRPVTLARPAGAAAFREDPAPAVGTV